MKKKTKFLLGTAAIAGVYSVITGKGPFNKIRFAAQHEHISRYVNSHYHNAAYSPIEATENGWVTVIRRIGMPKIILYVTCDDDGNYIFEETEIAHS